MSRLLPVRTHTGLSEELLHRHLAGTHPSRLSPALDAPDWERDQERELAARSLERDFVERERACVASLVRGVPTQANEFVAWFEGLIETGPGQGDPLHQSYLRRYVEAVSAQVAE